MMMIVLAGGVAAWLVWGCTTSNPNNYKTIGEIPTPTGFERLADKGDGYATYLRSLPLQPRGSEVMLFTGGRAHHQWLNYAVVDIPLISNDEQCADCCMRLRSEYLFSRGQYGKIHFQSVNRETLQYNGGTSRKALENYLRKVYGIASTYSLCNEMPHRKIQDIRPGDVWVYAAPKGKKYGHAIMVVDVAVNEKTGQKALLLAQGATPARNIHVMRNTKNLLRSPWFILDNDDEMFYPAPFTFKAENLRYFKD